MPFTDFVIPAMTALVTEMGDKSQLMIVALAAKYRDSTKVVLGVMAAFVVAHIIAAGFGHLTQQFFPQTLLYIISGLLFLLFGIYAFLTHEDGPLTFSHGGALAVSFGVLLLAELGDKTQLATAVLAMNYDPLLVFVGMMAGLLLTTLAALFLGKTIKKIASKNVIHITSGSLFVIIGLFTLGYGLL